MRAVDLLAGAFMGSTLPQAPFGAMSQQCADPLPGTASLDMPATPARVWQAIPQF